MSTVYIVHSIDAEGPLFESTEETFVRIQDFFGQMAISPTKENLKLLQEGKIELPNEAKQRAAFNLAFSPTVLNYMRDFAELDEMISRIMAPAFRDSLKDDFGQSWIYSWHCIDHLDYEENPRRRLVGMHQIYDYYLSKIRLTNSSDKIHWHFHPSTFFNEGNRSTTNYTYSKNLYKILARRVIDRKWFPTANRAGYHTERVDSNFFLEQWIPFDLSNQAQPSEDVKRIGLGAGRFGDWRDAPSDWSWYHPSHDYYQLPGTCRRMIFRCLNVGTRHNLIDQSEVDAAFALAQKNGKALMAVTNHDFREMSQDMVLVHKLLLDAKKRFPEVKFKFMDAVDACRETVFSESELQSVQPIELSLRLVGNIAHIQLVTGSVFGPQPFFCFKTRDRRYFYDNLDILSRGKEWSYTFDADNIPLESIEAIGLASNDRFGNRHVISGKVSEF